MKNKTSEGLCFTCLVQLHTQHPACLLLQVEDELSMCMATAIDSVMPSLFDFLFEVTF